MRSISWALAVFAACSSNARHAAPPAPPPSTEAEPAAVPPPPPEPATPTLRLPDSFRPTDYRARLQIDPAASRFDGEIQITAALTAASSVVWLDAENLTIDKAEVTGPAPVALTATPTGKHFLALRAPQALPAGPLALHLVYHGVIDDLDPRGAWRRQSGADWYVQTQFESISARRVFPCVDEPGSKVPWQLTLDVPEGDVALSN